MTAYIPEHLLPLAPATPSAYVRVVVGDRSFNAPLPEVTNAAALVSEVINKIYKTGMEELLPVMGGVGYQPPVEYEQGIEVDNVTQTVSYEGVIYAPAYDKIPFTTTSSFKEENWRVIQGVTSADLLAPYGADMVAWLRAGFGARKRSVGKKLDEWPSVYDYIPEEHAILIKERVSDYDCTDDIERALADVAEKGLGTLWFDAGRFVVSRPIENPNGTCIEGAGMYAVTIDGSGKEGTSLMFVKGSFGFHIRGVGFKGSGKGSQPANGTDVDADDIANAGCGLILAGANRALVEICLFEDCGGTAGTGDENGVAGLWLTFGCRDSLVRDCFAVNCRNGFNEDNYFGVDPVGNTIINNTAIECRFGFAADSGSATTDTNISYNSAKGCLQSGYDINKSGRLKVTYNYAWGCGTESGNSGIFVYGTASIPVIDVDVVGNLCRQNYGHGIKVGPYVYRPNVSLNRCLENKKHGISIQGIVRHWSLLGNHTHGNDEDGIYVFTPSDNPSMVTTTGTMTANVAFQNKKNGFHLASAAEAMLVANVAKDNSQLEEGVYDGFRLARGTINCNLVANHSSGVKQRYAVAGVDNETVDNVFSGNRFLAGTLGRMGFANLRQTWTGNGDEYLTISGTPEGAYPYGSKVYNAGDKRLYVRDPSGWRYFASAAV